MLALFILSVRKLLAFLSSVKKNNRNKLVEIKNQLKERAACHA